MIKKLLIAGWAALAALSAYTSVQAATIPERLSGRILLQVQSKGEAWYVNPTDGLRYYLGRPQDAFRLMRSQGLGISEQDFRQFSDKGAIRLKGRILIRAQASGEAYYVNSSTARLEYLGRPEDAFSLMRRLGLGISDSDLARIPAATSSSAITEGRAFEWRFDNKEDSMQYQLDGRIFSAYADAPKVLSYYVGQEPEDPRDSFYGMFLKLRADDSDTLGVLAQLKRKAAAAGYDSDKTAAYAMSFIQYLPYDRAKLEPDKNIPYYPYETLYLGRGVCSDKTFLAVLWLRSLGYGAAILDFPESNHSAAGIACPKEDSIAGSGYCYIETTNYFPVGIVPPSIAEGQAVNSEPAFDQLFDASRLGKMEIKQATAGKLYQGVAAVKEEATALKNVKSSLADKKAALEASQSELDRQYQELESKQVEINAYRSEGNIPAYNEAVLAYNASVASYQEKAKSYSVQVGAYNQEASGFNERYRRFYQM
ncbi:MAG: hypothetical protein ACM3PZ_02605 [Bacillota bacterium]